MFDHGFLPDTNIVINGKQTDHPTPFSQGGSALALGLIALRHRLGHDVSLWSANLDSPLVPSSFESLSLDEKARMGRFRFAHDATRYGRSHALLRNLLGAVCGCSSSRVTWKLGAFGKPHLLGEFGWHFNMSHSGPLALFGISKEHPIGVDIEGRPPQTDDEILATARVCFGPREIAELQTQAPHQRPRLFLQGWARKEACLKAIGSGLSIAPGCFETGLGDGLCETVIPIGDQPCRVRFDTVELDTPLVCAAVAVLHEFSAHLAL